MSKKEKDEGLDAAFIISQAKPRNRELQPYSPDSDREETPRDVSEENAVEAPPSVSPRKIR